MSKLIRSRHGFKARPMRAMLPPSSLVVLAASILLGYSVAAYAMVEFRNTVTGAILNVKSSDAKTPEAKKFLETAKNPYRGDPKALKKGKEAFSYSCAGCHGHHGEGKLGPGLADDYWTYPKNKTDKGLFETIYGGATSMMGPQAGFMSIDEMLLAMAWVRELPKRYGKEAKK